LHESAIIPYNSIFEVKISSLYVDYKGARLNPVRELAALENIDFERSV